MTKKILLINRQPPYGSSAARDALDVVLTISAFAMLVSMLFLDDGVLQLKKNQQSKNIGLKNLSQHFPALSLYDVKDIYVEQESMSARGLSKDDLVIDVGVLPRHEIACFTDNHHVVLSF